MMRRGVRFAKTKIDRAAVLRVRIEACRDVLGRRLSASEAEPVRELIAQMECELAELSFLEGAE